MPCVSMDEGQYGMANVRRPHQQKMHIETEFDYISILIFTIELVLLGKHDIDMFITMEGENRLDQHQRTSFFGQPL